MPIIRAYSKKELRILINNPGIDLSNGIEVAQARVMRRETFNQLVFPIVKKECGTIITFEQFKRSQIVSPKVVEVLFRYIF